MGVGGCAHAWCDCVKKGNCHWPKQPLRAVWREAILPNGGGQFDQHCKLFNGAIPAQVLC